MKVKNYIVENCYEFIDELERNLCKKGISYVRIDREIHFLDQIIRFYDFKLDKDIMYRVMINSINIKDGNVVCSYSPKCIDFSTTKDNINKEFYQKQNRKALKYESRIVKQKIKKYSK